MGVVHARGEKPANDNRKFNQTKIKAASDMLVAAYYTNFTIMWSIRCPTDELQVKPLRLCLQRTCQPTTNSSVVGQGGRYPVIPSVTIYSIQSPAISVEVLQYTISYWDHKLVVASV